MDRERSRIDCSGPGVAQGSGWVVVLASELRGWGDGTPVPV